MKGNGNRISNEYFEASLPQGKRKPDDSTSSAALEDFIRY